MITWAMVLETIVKWGIPLIAAGILGLIVKYIVDPRKRDFNTGHKANKQEEWDSYVDGSKALLELTNKQTQVITDTVQTKLNELEQTSKQTDQEILLTMKDLQVAIKDLNNDVQEQNENVQLLQSGVLDMHLVNLIDTCKVYINRGYITPIELVRYEERLHLYEKLGGASHMRIWDERIRSLPLHDHGDPKKQQ